MSNAGAPVATSAGAAIAQAEAILSCKSGPTNAEPDAPSHHRMARAAAAPPTEMNERRVAAGMKMPSPAANMDATMSNDATLPSNWHVNAHSSLSSSRGSVKIVGAFPT